MRWRMDEWVAEGEVNREGKENWENFDGFINFSQGFWSEKKLFREWKKF